MTEPPAREPSRRILIVDDEDLARQRVRRYLSRHSRFEIAEAESGLEAVAKIASFRPDIVFLDIEMPGLNGFEVLAQFPRRPFHVVFQTAYDEFAIRAFEECAIDYLLKPFTQVRFEKALALGLLRVTDEERLKSLETAMRVRDGYLRRLSVRQGNRLRIVCDDDIVCFVSRDHCTCLYLSDGREAIVDLSLATLVERLDPKRFHQLHRSSIVNLTEIRSVERALNSSVTVELSNGLKLAVSRRQRLTVLRLIKDGLPPV